MNTLLKWTVGYTMWFDWSTETPQRHCQHKMGTIHGHACYREKPMTIIWLNALFQMPYKLQRIRNPKKHGKKKI